MSLVHKWRDGPLLLLYQEEKEAIQRRWVLGSGGGSGVPQWVVGEG